MIVKDGKTYESEFNSILDSHVSPSKDEWSSVTQSPNFVVGSDFEQLKNQEVNLDLANKASLSTPRMPLGSPTEPAGALKPEGRYPPTGSSTPQGFLPDVSKKQGGWPKVVDYAIKVLDPRKMATSAPETPIEDLLKTEYHSTSLGKAMTKASEEFEQEHGLDHIDALKNVKINSKAWDAWLESRPESKNIQDRRGGMTNGQYLVQKLQDLHRLGSWETGDIEGHVPK